MSGTNKSNLRFPPQVIERQLTNILGAPSFQVADQLSRFLRYVVEETLAGRQDQIKQYTVGVHALGRDASFKPQLDPIVRMQAGRLRRALQQYYDSEGVDDPIQIDIPKGGYIPVFLPRSHMHQPAAVDSAESIDVLDDDDYRRQPSIAVMPLVYLGADKDNAFYATGLTEEMLVALTQFSEFTVIGPLKRDVIWKQHLDVRGIGKAYKVRFVLDGTVRRLRDVFRVTAKLIDTLSGQHLWGETYEYNLGSLSIVEVNQLIVGQVAAKVADNFGIVARTLAKESLERSTTRLSDYEAVLRFHHHISVATETSLLAAIQALQLALERNPDNFLAAALLGDLLASLYHLGVEDATSLIDQAESLGWKAIALNPNCQPAHYTMALVYFLRFQRELCLQALEKTLMLNPNNANYLAASALLLSMLGEWKRGTDYMRQAMFLNPHHPGWYHFVPYMSYYRQGNFSDAHFHAQQFNTRDFFWDPLIRAAIAGQLDKQAEAKKAKDELFELVPEFPERGRSLMRRVVFFEDNVSLLLEGLNKAQIIVA